MEYDTQTQVILKNPPWWERRSNLERRVIMISAILFVIAVILLVALGIVLLQTNRDNDYYPYSYDYEMDNYREQINQPRTAGDCPSPGCIHAASTILKYMDRSVQPCHDFYHFACGGFINETGIPGDTVSVDTFSSAFDLLQEQLRTVIEDPPEHKTSEPFSLLKRLYDICMDTASAESHSLQDIKMILTDLGGWPVLEEEDWDEQGFDWLDSLIKFRRVGYDVNHFMTLEVSTDYNNNSRTVFVLDEPVLGHEKYILTNGLTDNRVKEYFLYMIEVARLFGANEEFAVNELKTALEFEIDLAKHSFAREVWNRTNIYHTMSVSELQTRYRTINWIKYINGVVGLPDFQVAIDDMVIVRSPQYISELERTLGWTSKRVQSNYIMWRAVKTSVQFLTERLRNRRYDYFAEAYGITDRTPRWKECVAVVTTGVPFAVGYLYVHKYVEQNAREILFEMISYIRNQMMELIKRVDWMDDITKMNALEKTDSMAVRMAYLDEFLTVKNLQQYYAELKLPMENYLRCILTLNLFEREKYFGQLRRTDNKFEKKEEDMYTTTVYPQYELTRNILYIPSGILQGTFFSTDRPQFLNYGALGYLIGHEIARGVDNFGKNYDRHGYNVEWWTEYTKKAFLQKAHCLNNDRRNYTLPEVEVYDLEIREYNVADNAGIKAAYWAYNVWVEHLGNEYRIPSLNYYTPMQLFWISAAQTKCTKYRPEYLKNEGYTKEHSPAYYKVFAAVSNSEDFARDFHCPLGSPMNPIHKCYVW